MSELKYNQIVDKLNTEFASEGRRLVFWYDDNGYFADDVDAMPLQNAKIWHLTPTNQFRTKILLEREDPQSNYLIYAPFPKPPVEQNHLEDTILYSKQFHADPISLLCSDLGIGAEGKAVLQKYAKVVGEQTRKQRFCDYKLAAYTADAVETALLCTVCKCRTAQFEDALREILLADTPDANPKLDELAKYLYDKETITGDEFMTYVNAENKKLTDGSEPAQDEQDAEAPASPDAPQEDAPSASD